MKVEGGRLIQAGRAWITTSWDDGHPLDMRLAELLAKYGLPATFYIPLHNERETLRPEQVRELSKIFEVGGHTVNHRDLNAVSHATARREIFECKAALEEITGRRCDSFCFPLGHFRRRHLMDVRDAGFKLARTVEMLSTSKPKWIDGVALMPTTIQAHSTSFIGMMRNTVKRVRLMPMIKYACARRAGWSDTAKVMVEDVLRRGGVFHLWGHSWEIDENNAWGDLEEAFRHLMQAGDCARLATNGALAGE